ncbi:MAG: hypothetical protein FWD09_08045 [Lentimicrobiaceae bacterium]|nr:hypothetical protein [Lentimicrobiaceae bacterium]
METTEVLHIENQTNKKETKNTEQDDTKSRLSNFCLDVAKYTLTGIFFTSIVGLIKSETWAILFSMFMVTIFMSIGITLNKLK